MALVLTKERLNDFIKTGEVKEQSEIFDEFGIFTESDGETCSEGNGTIKDIFISLGEIK